MIEKKIVGDLKGIGGVLISVTTLLALIELDPSFYGVNVILILVFDSKI